MSPSSAGAGRGGGSGRTEISLAGDIIQIQGMINNGRGWMDRGKHAGQLLRLRSRRKKKSRPSLEKGEAANSFSGHWDSWGAVSSWLLAWRSEAQVRG